jgi:membrane-associated phospholipid phosphatase
MIHRLYYAIGLSLLFVVLYGASNHYASTLSEHWVLRYGWERHIPMLPAFIIPYMSIDLFFFFSFFICTTNTELRTHAARLAVCTIVAVCCFVIFPMKLGMERPHLAGVNGAIYALLKSFDHPHNLFPSLHVAYTLILRMLYSRHTRGLTWWLFHAWFFAVSFSVLFVHQHHVIDLIGGAALATVVMYFVPSRDRRRALPPRGAGNANRFVAGWFALGAVACAAAIGYEPRWWPLVWPAFMFVLLAAAYLGVGPRVFRKLNGKLPLNVQVIYGPYLVGLWISRGWFNRNAPPWYAVQGDLLIGRVLTAAEARRLVDSGCAAVLDLTAEHTAPVPLRSIHYLNAPVLDLTIPDEAQRAAAIDFIDRHIRKGPVFIHCGLGRSRSAAIIVRYLLHSRRVQDASEALAVLRAVHPKVRILPESIALERT